MSAPSFKLILASSSPRRRDLLQSAGLEFIIRPPDIREQRRAGESAVDFARRAAREKAEAVRTRPEEEPCLVLGADTVVVCDDAILGKPADPSDARRMLNLLSGRAHEVVTGYALQRRGPAPDATVDAVITRVVFNTLSAGDIDAYIATGEPMDKAGAYGIQGQAAWMVRGIEGSYTNVVGLPLCEVVTAIRRMISLH